MASREEEKRRRREEREAQQRKEAAAASRAKRLQIGLASLLALAVVAGGISIVITQSGGGDGGSGKTQSVEKVAYPKVGPTELKAAAKAADCVLLDPPNEGSTHVEEKVTYKSNPPTSGNHHPQPASDGAYAPGNEPAPENFVHSLEHGRIQFQYKPGTPENRIKQLESAALEPFNGVEDYHTQVFQNPTGMEYAVAAVAWDHVMGCKTFKDEFFNAAMAFRRAYTDKAPELIPGRQ